MLHDVIPSKVKDKVLIVAALLLGAKYGVLQQGVSNPREVHKRIRHILEDVLGWSQTDAAKIGIRIDNLLGASYKGIAYYNPETKQFEWG